MSVSQLRIIAGKWRSRLLHFPEVDALRPTHDRVRETVFNWLSPYVVGSRCLDLFAGTGAFGFEALSRGAAQATFIERESVLVDNLRANADKLAASAQCQFILGDVLQKLPMLHESFDIVFIDPPYRLNLLKPTIDALVQHGCLSDQAIVYLEAEKSLSPLPVPTSWQCLKSKATKTLQYALFLAV